ncbi:arylsulfatase [Deminuibacter soli]|uniref:arylsulfatase n=1 Tax=Deminuibacter soli TaxID=2291815 RepID=UPI001B87FEBC|nr:arylsulfatase [Deminuibacter soli]
MKNFLRLSQLLMLTFLLQTGIAQRKPNIVLIMADDMGYSDIGCYGSEIPTPNLDKLAGKGIRFRHFYNNARCCPTRATLMTGLFPHQTGIGHMTEEPADPNGENWGTPGYQGYLNRNCVTLAEVLGANGYHTYMSGKWHLGMHGEQKWPLQRGFERYYGILAGAASYFRPQGGRGLTYNNTQLPAPQGDYYTTDAFTDSAISFVNAQHDSRPFFLYLAYNAPHWPLQAKAGDIKKFEGVYAKGWDAIRRERYARQLQSGIVDRNTPLSQRDTAVRPWTDLSAQEQKDVAYRMAVYAAQVSCIDQNIGKLVTALEKKGELDNTIIVFLSDNGACPEPYKELGGGTMADINNPELSGAISYGMGWANASNTPYRKWKRETEEGGIAAPFIISWPKGIARNQQSKIIDAPCYLIDVMPTFLELSNTAYPKTYKNNIIYQLEGTSIAAVCTGRSFTAHPCLYWEHEGNRAIRKGNWKAVKDGKSAWALYNLSNDPTEEKNVAAN